MPWRPLPNPDGELPTPLATTVDRVLQSLGAPPTDTLGQLFSTWSVIVGEAIASASEPVSLEHHVLVVAVRDGGWASQLRWMQTDLLVRINTHLGQGTVTHLEVRVRPV